MTTRGVFVSSALADASACEALVAGLRAAGVDVWYDPEGTGNTEHELATRPCFLVVLSPTSFQSQQVRFEVAGALQLMRRGAIQTLIPVLLPDCELPPGLDRFPAISLDTPRNADHSQALAAILATIEKRATRAGPEPVALVPRDIRAAPPSGAAEPIVLPPQLTSLGYTGWHIQDLDVMLPPLSLVNGVTFVMGSQHADAPADEQPAHTLTLPTFAIATFPVIVAEYACFVGAGHALPPDMGRITWSGQFSRLDHPVVNVSWHDANAYAKWLAARTGGRWRLPTEAEWECAARWDAAAQRAREYPWGDSFELERCNIRESSIGTTTPIHLYANGASPSGAREMVGNVREWTSTRYAPYPYDASDGREQQDGANPRVQRGGSWFSFASEVRAAARDWQAPDTISAFVGFRLVLEAPPAASPDSRR